VRLIASLAGIAETRLRNTARRARLRALLIAGAGLAGALAFGFALAAVTVALARAVGVMPALWIVAGVALSILLGLLIALSAEARRHRQIAAERERLDRQLYRAAALSAIPRRSVSRTGLGLGLVALGALLVLVRRD
jgi:nitroreductase